MHSIDSLVALVVLQMAVRLLGGARKPLRGRRWRRDPLVSSVGKERHTPGLDVVGVGRASAPGLAMQREAAFMVHTAVLRDELLYSRS